MLYSKIAMTDRMNRNVLETPVLRGRRQSKSGGWLTNTNLNNMPTSIRLALIVAGLEFGRHVIVEF